MLQAAADRADADGDDDDDEVAWILMGLRVVGDDGEKLMVGDTAAANRARVKSFMVDVGDRGQAMDASYKRFPLTVNDKWRGRFDRSVGCDGWIGMMMMVRMIARS